MKVHFHLTMLLVSAAFIVSCAHQNKPEPLAPGWEPSGTPIVAGFDPDTVIAAAQKLLGYKGAIALVPMNSVAREQALLEIIDGMQDTRSRGEVVICLSRDSRLIADAVSRALGKFPDVDLSGLKIVIAAPHRASDDFLALLRKRNIESHFLHVEAKK